jgi:hypothetical protein
VSTGHLDDFKTVPKRTKTGQREEDGEVVPWCMRSEKGGVSDEGRQGAIACLSLGLFSLTSYFPRSNPPLFGLDFVGFPVLFLAF